MNKYVKVFQKSLKIVDTIKTSANQRYDNRHFIAKFHESEV